MTTETNTAKWAQAQASRQRDAYFDLALAIIDDHFDDDVKAPKVVAECAANDYDLSLGFARQVIMVAKAWGTDKLVTRRVFFNSFRPVATLVSMTGTLPGVKSTGGAPTPTLTDGTIDTETLFTNLITGSSKPITHRDVLRACGKANFDDTAVAPLVASADVLSAVVAEMAPESLQDRINNDPEFRDALVDMIVLGGTGAKPGPVSGSTTGPALPLNVLAVLKKAESQIRIAADLVTADASLADIARTGRTSLQTALDLLDLSVNGIAAI